MDLEAIARKLGLEPEACYRQGAVKIPTRPEKGRWTESGIQFLASEAEFEEFDQQKEDAIAYLKKHGNALTKLLRIPGVSGEIDFGIVRRDVAVQCDRFPAELLTAVSAIGLELSISVYPLLGAEE